MMSSVKFRLSIVDLPEVLMTWDHIVKKSSDMPFCNLSHGQTTKGIEVNHSLLQILRGCRSHSQWVTSVTDLQRLCLWSPKSGMRKICRHAAEIQLSFLYAKDSIRLLIISYRSSIINPLLVISSRNPFIDFSRRCRFWMNSMLLETGKSLNTPPKKITVRTQPLSGVHADGCQSSVQRYTGLYHSEFIVSKPLWGPWFEGVRRGIVVNLPCTPFQRLPFCPTAMLTAARFSQPERLWVQF